MRILFVDHHAEFTAVVGAVLATHEVVVVPSLEAARRELAHGRFDVALVDFDLDDGKAIDRNDRCVQRAVVIRGSSGCAR